MRDVCEREAAAARVLRTYRPTDACVYRPYSRLLCGWLFCCFDLSPPPPPPPISFLYLCQKIINTGSFDTRRYTVCAKSNLISAVYAQRTKLYTMPPKRSDKKSGGVGGGGGKGGKGNRRDRTREVRTEAVIASENNEGGDDSAEEELQDGYVHKIDAKIYLWEFGQNDPKRDSGSKMVKLGYAGKLRIGQSFPGIVLSSEAQTFVNPSDVSIVETHGIAGINCSWNRLDEIPFDSMGKGRNQRLLPLLFAANSVNYGKPYKMNTAEATAACLYITGFKDDAHKLMDTFPYGPEFLRLNGEALEAYSCASDAAGVKALNDAYLALSAERRGEKEAAREASALNNAQVGGYMDDMDLPPMGSDDEGGEWVEEEEEEERPPVTVLKSSLDTATAASAATIATATVTSETHQSV